MLADLMEYLRVALQIPCSPDIIATMKYFSWCLHGLQNQLQLTESQELGLLRAQQHLITRLQAVGKERSHILSAVGLELLQTNQARPLPPVCPAPALICQRTCCLAAAFKGSSSFHSRSSFHRRM